MASNNINVGNESNDGKGQTLRDGFISVRKNIAEIFGITYTSDTQDLSGVQFSSDVVTEGETNKYLLTNSVTNEKMFDDSVGAAELIDNSVGTEALNVSGEGDAGSVLKSDGDGSMSWINPADTLAEVLAIGNTTGGSDIAVSANDDITFTDSSEAIFGTGADLKIYHNGTNAKIVNSTGDLNISGGNVNVSGGNLAAPTFLGELNGTINALTTGVTQNAATNDTTIATTAYADAAAAAVPIADYLPLAGGALTGALTGTTAAFTGSVSATGVIFANRTLEVLGQNLTHGASRIKICQENTNKSQIRYYGADASTKGSLEFIASTSDGSSFVTPLSIDSSGNSTFAGNTNISGSLGVGMTTAPRAKLDVSTPDPATDFQVLDFRNPSDFGIFATSSSVSGKGNTLNFKSSDYNSGNGIQTNNVLSLHPTGNVGIGTDSPGAKLDIHAATNSNGILIREDNDDSITHNFYIDSADNGVAALYANGQTQKIVLNTSGDSYFNGGNVGIGTTSPGAKLDVRGEALVGDGTDGVKLTYSTGNSTGIIDTGYSSTGLEFRTGGTERMRIASNGNVGIGITSPGAKLEVEGVNGQFGVLTSVGGVRKIGLYNHATNGSELYMYNPNGIGLANLIRTSGSSYFNAGNVGIGTTSPGAKLHVHNAAGGDATDKATMLSEAVLKLQPHATNSTNLLVAQVNGGNGIGFQVTNGSGTANWDIALSPFGGNVGIGTTSPGKTLEVKSTGNTAIRISTDGDAGDQPEIQFYRNGNDYAVVKHKPGGGSASGLILTNYRSADSNIIFNTAGENERMRITSGGDIAFGTTSNNISGGAVYFDELNSINTYIKVGHKTGSTSGSDFLACYYNGTQIGGVAQSGTTGVSFNQSSDYRLKEDLQDFNGLDMISNIPVYDFKWKVDESRSYGVMAHELQEEYEITPAVLDEEGNVSEEAVMGTRNDNQGVDYSKIVPLLVKSIQELKAEIELLKLNN